MRARAAHARVGRPDTRRRGSRPRHELRRPGRLLLLVLLVVLLLLLLLRRGGGEILKAIERSVHREGPDRRGRGRRLEQRGERRGVDAASPRVEIVVAAAGRLEAAAIAGVHGGRQKQQLLGPSPLARAGATLQLSEANYHHQTAH